MDGRSFRHTSPLTALPAKGELLFGPKWCTSAGQHLPPIIASSRVLAFLYFKSELYYILKHERYPIQISNVLVWINRVARKVPAAKKGSYGCDSLLPAQSQDCVGKLGTHYRSVCSAAELAFTNYMCWFCK